MVGIAEKISSAVVLAKQELISLSDKEYELIRNLVYERFGINLTEQKRTLIMGRLNKVLKQKGIKSFEEYYKYVISDKSGEALSKMVDKISTNHTFFYREKEHFEYLLDSVLPEFAQKAKKGAPKCLRIWCSASSSGEEPYTLAMLLAEYFKNDLGSWDTGVLATDISTDILKAAHRGIYQKNNVSQMPAFLKNKYFQELPSGELEIKQSIKDMVLFRRLNLMRKEFPFKGKFHIIFSRNVMIYFDEPTRRSLVSRYSRYMEDGGYLFIGHSETLGRDNNFYRYIKPAVYRKETAS